MWRVGWLIFLVFGFFSPTTEVFADAGGSVCSVTRGHVSSVESFDRVFWSQPDVLVGGARWNHAPRVQSARYFTDLMSWDSANWTVPSYAIVDPGSFPRAFALRPTLDTAGSSEGFEFAATASMFPPLPSSQWLKIFGGRSEDAHQRVTYELLVASDAGHLLHGATLREPSGRTKMCASFAAVDGGSTYAPPVDLRLVVIEYGADAGVRTHFTDVPLDLCRELLALDGGYVLYSLDDWPAAPAEKVNPLLRARFVELSPREEVLSNTPLDAGFCVIDGRNPRSGWCDSITHDEVLRYESWRGPPSSVFRHDGGLTVIADIEGHLLVGVNELHTGDGFARFDLGWLRDGRFTLIKERQVVPIGYGAWDAGSAALTIMRPDLEGWDVVEVSYDCR